MSRLLPTVVGMSTLTQAQPAPDTRPSEGSRLVGPPLALTFMAEFASLASFMLLVSVMPMLAADGRSRQRRGRADHRRAAWRHGDRGGRGGVRDQALRLPGGARGRGAAAGRADAGAAAARAAGDHGRGQPRARARLRALRRRDRRADRAAAPARTPRRGPRPARPRLRGPRHRRPAGRRLAGRPPAGDGGGGRCRGHGAAAAGGPALAAARTPRLAAGRRSGGGRRRRAPAGAGLRRLHGGGRGGRLVPPARQGSPERHRLDRAAGPVDHRHPQPLAGRPPRRPHRPRPAAGPGRHRGRARHGRADLAGVARGDAGGAGAVRGRLRRGRELDVRAADRAAARGPGRARSGTSPTTPGTAQAR